MSDGMFYLSITARNYLLSLSHNYSLHYTEYRDKGAEEEEERDIIAESANLVQQSASRRRAARALLPQRKPVCF